MPTSWRHLYDEVDRLDLSNRRLLAARANFDAWAQRTEERCLRELHDTARERSQELLARTGVSVIVEASARDERHRRGPVTLRVGTSRVDLYSVREPGASPCIHLGVQRGATSTRFPVFATIPGVLLIRALDGDYEMLSLPFEDGTAPPRTTADAFVLRAFDVLLGTHRSTLRALTH